MSDLGALERKGNRIEARITRRFPYPPQQVWEFLTGSAKLAQWLAPGAIDARVGGLAQLNFVDSGIVIDSEITACEPHRTLCYSWGKFGDPPRPVRWDLDRDGVGTRLTLTLGVPSDEDVARSCAGWEAHLEMLAAALEGVPIKFPFERFQASREAYKRMLA